MEKNDQHIEFDLLTRFLAKDISAEEQTRVKKWIAATDKNRSEFAEIQKVWQTLGKTSIRQDIDVDAEWRYHQRKIHTAPDRSGRNRLFSLVRIAASVLLFIGAAWLFRNYIASDTSKTHTAETREVMLPDGSKVTLNQDSKFSYNKAYGQKTRRVRLQGEAYFEVEKDSETPFIIQMDDAEIRVLGTSFNVKAYKNTTLVEVTVAEGMVSLYDRKTPQMKVIASKGEKAVFNKQLKVVKKKSNSDRNFNSWKTRQIVFENDSLQDIVSTLRYVYHKDIVIKDFELHKCTMTTRFENESLGTVLKIIESTLDITIEEKEGVILLYGGGC